MTIRKANRIARDLSQRFTASSLTTFIERDEVSDDLWFDIMGIINYIAINPFPSRCPHNPFWTAKEVREAWELLDYVKQRDITEGRAA